MHRLSVGIQALQERLLTMSGLVEQSIGRSVRSLVERDASLAEIVLRDEKLVDALEIEIDDHAMRLLALHQPVACDLRYLTTALKINTDLERIGDLATTIARRSLSLMQQPIVKPLIDIPRMAELTQSMLANVLRAFVDRDPELARAVLAADDEVDVLRDVVTRDLVEIMRTDASMVERGVDLMFIARSLERIADHSTNIAEEVLFLVRGIDVRHSAQRVA
jgi:phosphate transport system protein